MIYHRTSRFCVLKDRFAPLIMSIIDVYKKQLGGQKPKPRPKIRNL
jgi:hypothetical protein